MGNRKRPSHPSKHTPQRLAAALQLGEPHREREAKSNGFEREQIAEGGLPIVRSREKSILTPPDVRRGLIEEAIKDLRDRGIFELDGTTIRIKETAADRLLLPVEHEAICWFIRVHAKVHAGKVKISSYGGGIKGDDSFDRPLLNYDKALHAELQKVLPEAHLAFLEWLSAHEYPGSFEGTPPSQIDIGKQIIDSRDARRATGGLEGFLRAVSQNIAHWRGEIETVWARRDAMEQERQAHRKKAFAA
jgi:hypothetical protein